MSLDWKQEKRTITTQEILDWLGDMNIVVRFFEARDEMNAAVHATDAIRYSPITELARRCRRTIDQLPLATSPSP